MYKVKSLEELEKKVLESGNECFRWAFYRFIDIWKNFFVRECRDFLMGVGKKFYQEEAVFFEEALRLGVSKRVPKLPAGLCFGRSRIFLVHWKTRMIFMYFVPCIELIVRDNKEKECLQQFIEFLESLGIPARGNVNAKTEEEAKLEEEARGCGTRRTGRYAISMR